MTRYRHDNTNGERKIWQRGRGGGEIWLDIDMTWQMEREKYDKDGKGERDMTRQMEREI